jgi:hypothetical protein
MTMDYKVRCPSCMHRFVAVPENVQSNIKKLRARIAMLEAEVAALCKADIKRIPTRDARVRELEAVAEAAEAYSHLNGEGTCDELAAYYAASDKLDDALRAAGYLKEDKPK